jgi:Asp-tRNA(Asn)/Glu-tRNA(Gln) amidotransferase A subunit family amidase
MVQRRFVKRLLGGIAVAGVSAVSLGLVLGATEATSRTGADNTQGTPAFDVVEATIDDNHRAIQQGRTTCTTIVQEYINRARAYNGTCTQLVTRNGGSVSPGSGALRAGSPIAFPSATTPVSTVLPQFDQYVGLPIEFGRMEAAKSDPAVQQQFGMVVGIRNARQINALSTLNLRGERSVSCKAECDAPPSSGPLPAKCPAACDDFRKQPDALEQAAQLDARYGSKPDLSEMPMYCVVFSFKDAYDTKDMRSTAGGDVSYAMDAPPRDSTIVSRLRAKGAIIYAKANLDEYNSGSGDPGGAAQLAFRSFGAGARSTWGGTACNPYDTARESGASSSGSATSVAANLVQCSICEETGGSCRQPAWRNSVVALVTTKGLMPYGGAIGADPYLDRAGIHCRTVKDTAHVLDAVKDPERGYFDPRDIYSALPKALVSKEPYASFALGESEGGSKPLAGIRIGIVREYMVKHTANDTAMSDQINDEIKKVLHDQLGAELVESFDPLYEDDPSIPNLTYNFQHALAEIVPFHLPEYLQRTDSKGTLSFAVPNFDVTKRDYIVKVADGQAPLSEQLNLRSISSSPGSANFSFHLAQYLLRRGDERVKDWASLNANAKYHSERRTVAMKNWENKLDLVSEGMTQNIKMREAMRLVIVKVMRQNNLDVLVNPTSTIPPVKIGYATQPTINSRPSGRFPTSSNVGIPEITVPAGFNRIVYEPEFVLNASKDNYVTTANNTDKSLLENSLPVGISFWAGPGDEPALLKVAAAYEAATKHRVPPSAFGPLQRKY